MTGGRISIKVDVERDGAEPLSLAVVVAGGPLPIVTGACTGSRVTLDARETAELLTDELHVSHGRALEIVRLLIGSAHQLAELTAPAGAPVPVLPLWGVPS